MPRTLADLYALRDFHRAAISRSRRGHGATWRASSRELARVERRIRVLELRGDPRPRLERARRRP